MAATAKRTTIEPGSVMKMAATDTTKQIRLLVDSRELVDRNFDEIDRAMDLSSQQAADLAANQIADIDTQTRRLSDATTKMGGVLDLIHAIAGQINRLAFTATIESARADAANQGLAVVASEVKSLANQAAAVTQGISREILGMQTVAVDVTLTLATLRQSITNIHEPKTATASTVEEPSAAHAPVPSAIARAKGVAAVLAR